MSLSKKIIKGYLDSFSDLTCYTLAIRPNTKPRMTKNDCHRPNHKKYWIYKEDLQFLAAKSKLKDLPSCISFIIFYVKTPKMSKVKSDQIEGAPVPKRPDIDNYMKAFQDCLAKEDSHIHTVGMAKRYSVDPRIEMYVNHEHVAKMDAYWNDIYNKIKL